MLDKYLDNEINEFVENDEYIKLEYDIVSHIDDLRKNKILYEEKKNNYREYKTEFNEDAS